MIARMFLIVGCCLLITGCFGLLDDQPKPKQSIIGKTTKDIGKADDNDRKNASDSKVRVDNPVTGPLQAYGPMMEQIAKLNIDHAVDLFHASEGRYPKDYKEFMSRIIEENHIQLPVLPFGAKYKYDEVTHKLLIVPSDEKPAAK